jgi:hypothetical protein
MLRARLAGATLRFEPRAAVWHNTLRRSFPEVIDHAQTWGYHAIQTRWQYADLLGTPRIFRRWWTTLLAAPIVASAVTARIYARNPAAIRYSQVLPIVWLAKFAWCVGAARRLREGGLP